jgi:adenylylsulfate reductase subunit A
MEETMQKIMDQYAGGIGSDYRYSEASLAIADEKIRQLQEDMHLLSAADMDELLQIYELRERLIVCRAVIAHLKARKETRWHSFAEHTDYPGTDDRYLKYVNSRMEDGRIQIILRELVTGGDGYEHQD